MVKTDASHRISEATRLKIADHVRVTGNTSKTARKLHVTRKAVSDIRKKEMAGYDVTKDYPRSGRPKILKPAQAAAVRRSGKALVRASKIKARVSKALHKPISQKTVQRTMTQGRIALE